MQATRRQEQECQATTTLMAMVLPAIVAAMTARTTVMVMAAVNICQMVPVAAKCTAMAMANAAQPAGLVLDLSCEQGGTRQRRKASLSQGLARLACCRARNQSEDALL